MEIRQRRLQRFHSSPVSQPSSREEGSSSGAGVATSETGLTGATGKTGVSSGTGDSAETDI